MKAVIRLANADDGAAVARIYEPYVLQTPITFEETPPTGMEMSQRITQTLQVHPYLVADVNGAVAGYAYAGLHHPRASYRWSVTVAIYLDETQRRKGIGKALYRQLLPLVVKQGFVMAYAGITLPNAASVRLHEGLGFTPVGIYHKAGYKLSDWRDVGWWEKPLVESIPAVPAEPIAWTSMPAFEPVELSL